MHVCLFVCTNTHYLYFIYFCPFPHFISHLHKGFLEGIVEIAIKPSVAIDAPMLISNVILYFVYYVLVCNSINK